MRRLASSDRSTLIRLASAMPKGNATRRAILAGLTQTKVFNDYMEQVWDGGKKKVSNPNPKTRDKYPEVSVSTAMKDKKSPVYKQVMDGFKKWNEEGKNLEKDLKKDTAHTAISSIFKGNAVKDLLKAHSAKPGAYSALRNMSKNYLKLQGQKGGSVPDFVDAVENDLKELRSNVYAKTDKSTGTNPSGPAFRELEQKVTKALGKVIDEYYGRKEKNEGGK